MIRRPPRSTQSRSSAASDVYKRQGSLDLFPEYTGNALAYIDKNATATSSDDVYAALAKALPSNLIALDQAEAQDRDAIVVTQETADKFKLKTIADLAQEG